MKMTIFDFIKSFPLSRWELTQLEKHNWGRLKPYVWDYIKYRDGKCLGCGTTNKLTIDHIVPKDKGGLHYNPKNLQTLCGTCNQLKANYYDRKL